MSKDCCNNCTEGKSCCSKTSITEAKFTDATLAPRIKHWASKHKGTGIGYGHVLGQLAVHMKEMGWNKSYKEVARVAVELGHKKKVESVNELKMNPKREKLKKEALKTLKILQKELKRIEGFAKDNHWGVTDSFIGASIKPKIYQLSKAVIAITTMKESINESAVSFWQDMFRPGPIPKKYINQLIKKKGELPSKKHIKAIYRSNGNPTSSQLAKSWKLLTKEKYVRAASGMWRWNSGFTGWESVDESDLGLTYKKGKTVKVKHKSSGKRLVIVDKPNVRKEYEKIGYFAESVNESKVLKFTDIKDRTLEKHLKVVTKKVGAELKKISGGFQVSGDTRALTAVVDYVFDKSIKKGVMKGGGMSNVNLVNESGILYRAGVKKYGKEGMRKIQQAAGKRKSHAEIGKIKDKYEKDKKESVIVEFDKYSLNNLLDSKLKKRLERTIKIIGGKVDAVGDDYIKFRMGNMDLNRLPAVIKKLDRNKNVWIGDRRKENIWDRKRHIDKLNETMDWKIKNKKVDAVLKGIIRSMGLKTVKDFGMGQSGISFFIDDEKEAKKLHKLLTKQMKNVRIINLDKSKGDVSNHVVYSRMFESEQVDEGFGSPELMKKKDLAEFEKTRQKNAEVLGYKLTGRPDHNHERKISVELENAKPTKKSKKTD